MMVCEIALFAFIPLADKYLNVGKKCLTKSLHRIFHPSDYPYATAHKTAPLNFFFKDSTLN